MVVAAVLRDLVDAVAVLTAVPVPRDARRCPSRGAVGWFPLVGLLLGAPVAGLLRWAPVSAAADRAPLLAAAIVLVLTALATRLMHLDGLGDVADAWWSNGDRAERLRIMRDPAVGAFGVSAIVLAMIVQAGALTELVTERSFLPLALVPALGRTAIVSACWFGRPARPDGLGRIFIGPPPRRAMASLGVSLVALAAVAWTFGGGTGAGFMVGGLAAAALLPHAVAKRVGGVTGDVMGASCVLVETALYAASALRGTGA